MTLILSYIIQNQVHQYLVYSDHHHKREVVLVLQFQIWSEVLLMIKMIKFQNKRLTYCQNLSWLRFKNTNGSDQCRVKSEIKKLSKSEKRKIWIIWKLFTIKLYLIRQSKKVNDLNESNLKLKGKSHQYNFTKTKTPIRKVRTYLKLRTQYLSTL